MGEVIEPAFQGDIEHFARALTQKKKAFFQTAMQEVGEERFARMRFEKTAQVVGLDARHGSELRQLDGFAKMNVQMLEESLHSFHRARGCAGAAGDRVFAFPQVLPTTQRQEKGEAARCATVGGGVGCHLVAQEQEEMGDAFWLRKLKMQDAAQMMPKLGMQRKYQRQGLPQRRRQYGQYETVEIKIDIDEIEAGRERFKPMRLMMVDDGERARFQWVLATRQAVDALAFTDKDHFHNIVGMQKFIARWHKPRKFFYRKPPAIQIGQFPHLGAR